jgi:hypothetical protein
VPRCRLTVSLCAFAPDGRSPAGASKKKTVLVEDLTDVIALRDNALQRACSISGGGLDREQWKWTRLVPGLP